MRVSRQLAPPVLAGVVIICAGTALATAPPSHASSGQAYVWVGNSTRSGGDDHSWTDARNWSPQAVPGSGDSVTVAPPSPDACGAGVDGVPAGTTLTALDLHETGAGVTLCPASLSGGDITVTGSFTWDGGSLATAVTVAAGAHGTVTATHATDRLAGGLTVDGTVDLSGLDADAPLVVARPASVTVGAGGVLTSDGDNAVSFTSCCTDPAHLVNDGTVVVDHGTLDVAGVQFDQNGVLDVVGGMLLTHAAPVTASDGAAYEGDGAWRIADAGPAARLSGRQLLGGRFHLHLGGGSPAASETLGGDVTLAGSGTFDWDSGTVAAELTVGHDVTVVVDGARRGNDARQLRGIDDSGAKPIAATVVDHGTVVVTGGARIGTAETAHLVVATDGTLRIAAGAGLAAAECCTHPDRVDNAGTTRLSSGATLTDLDYHQIAGRTEVTGGALPPAHTVRVDGGELVGVRTVRGALVAAGQVTPDGAGIGALHVTGDYTQQRDATLAVDVAARAHDTVRVDGAADVAGRITVDTAAGLPGVGTRIRILTADAGLRVHAGTCVVTRGNGAATRHWKPMASADGLDLVMVQGSSPNC